MAIRSLAGPLMSGYASLVALETSCASSRIVCPFCSRSSCRACSWTSACLVGPNRETMAAFTDSYDAEAASPSSVKIPRAGPSSAHNKDNAFSSSVQPFRRAVSSNCNIYSLTGSLPLKRLASISFRRCALLVLVAAAWAGVITGVNSGMGRYGRCALCRTPCCVDSDAISNSTSLSDCAVLSISLSNAPPSLCMVVNGWPAVTRIFMTRVPRAAGSEDASAVNEKSQLTI